MNKDFGDRVNQLIHDDDFFNWIINPTEASDKFWNNYITNNPDTREAIGEAAFYIKGLYRKGRKLNTDEIEKLWDRIDQSTHHKPSKIIRLSRWMAAAVIFFIIGIGSWLINKHIRNEVPIDYTLIPSVESTGNEVTLFLSDNTAETFTSDNVEILYDKHGKAILGSGEAISQLPANQTKEEEILNQLVVPRGRRSQLILGDGTRLWLNSGSRAIYPVVFNKKFREIYIEGEAYLEVAHDPAKPFYVKTEHLNINVLGTSFNITSYADDNSTSVILVEGSVQAALKSGNLDLKPNQMLSYEKSSGQTRVKNINVLEYISWKDGWLLCNREELGQIAVKLSRYYNINFDIRDPKINSLTISGKLDLKTDYEDVLTVIASTAPVSFQIDDKNIKVTMKKQLN